MTDDRNNAQIALDLDDRPYPSDKYLRALTDVQRRVDQHANANEHVELKVIIADLYQLRLKKLTGR